MAIEATDDQLRRIRDVLDEYLAAKELPALTPEQHQEELDRVDREEPAEEPVDMVDLTHKLLAGPKGAE